MSVSREAMVKLNGPIRKLVDTMQCPFISGHMGPEVLSWPSSICIHYQEKQKMHWGDEIHTNMPKVPHLSQGVLNSSVPRAKHNILELVQCRHEFLGIEVGLVCHVLIWKRSFRYQSTHLNNTTIDYKIPLLRAVTLHVADAYGLGNLPDRLPEFIVYPLYCHSPLLLPNSHSLCCLLTDCTINVLCPDAD